MTRWLAIVGIGEAGYGALDAQARALIEGAALIVGGARHLAMLPTTIGAEQRQWQTPLAKTVEEILAWRGKPVAILATGDPMWFGIGVTLARHLPAAEMTILPQPSAFSLAAARLGWPIDGVDCLTLHGRPIELLNGAVAPGARLLLLAHDGGSAAAVAAHLTQMGYGASRLIALEHMGGAKENRHEALARDWGQQRTADLNTLAVDCVAGADAVVRARVPGLPDAAFRHDGQLTKRELRAAALARLAPLPGELLWDVGAGCGSIAIEWLRCRRDLNAIAIEEDSARIGLIGENAAALGVPHLQIVQGQAPAALAGLAAPQAIFIGGGLTAPELIERCWSALAAGGRLVAHAVTVEGEAKLIEAHGRLGGDLIRLQIARAEPVGPFQGWRPLMPVTQWVAVKP